MDPQYRRNNPTGGDRRDSSFAPLPSHPRISSDDSYTAYEPPPGPPPNWSSRTVSSQALPGASQTVHSGAQGPSSLKTDQACQTPLNRTPPMPSTEWKFPKPHPCGVVPLAECASGGPNLDLDWFRHPSVPSFYICTRCYAEHVYSPRFHHLFERVHLKAAEGTACLFGSTRMKGQLWPVAALSGDLGPVLHFMKRRAALPSCPRDTFAEGRDWYISQDIPGSTICPACFEDAALEPPIRDKFVSQRVENGCSCDMACVLLQRLVKETKRAEDWQALVQLMGTRITIPACPKRDRVNAQGRPWFQTNNKQLGLQICAACYLDYFAGTSDAESFHRVQGGNGDTHCDVGNSYLQAAAEFAMEKQDLTVFWRAAQVVQNQPCTAEGIPARDGYTLTSNPAGFGICPSCYASLIGPLEIEHFFARRNQFNNGGEKVLCAFNINHDRISVYFPKLMQTAVTGNSRFIEDYASTYGNILSCPRDHYKRGKNRKFWGWGVSAICEECYVSFAKGTSLEGSFALKGAPDADGRMCDMYSPRMRRLYLQACQTGDLRGFLAVAEQRHEVWCATIAVCDRIEKEMLMRAYESQQLYSSSMFYKALGNNLDNTIGHTYTVGNAYAGYGHANEHVLTGHTLERQAQEASAEAVSMSSSARMAMLRQQWAEVE